MFKELLKFGLPMMAVAVLINLALLAGAIWVVVWVLRALGVLPAA